VIVNRENRIVQINEEVWNNFRNMVYTGMKDDQYLDITSGYRSFQHQQRTLNKIVARHGISAIGRRVALPGTSEHQLGVAIDVSNFTREGKMRSDSNRFKWMHEHCPEFGFILRYKREFEETTGVMFEPWHLRYVGRENALKITEMNIALEEYVALL